jgi:hypothetical protein
MAAISPDPGEISPLTAAEISGEQALREQANSAWVVG